MRDTFVFFLQYMSFLFAALYAFSFLGGSFWFCDVLSNFKLQYLVSIVVLTFCGFIFKRSKWTLLYFIIAALIFIDIQPWWKSQDTQATDRTLLVSGINLYSDNDDAKSVITMIDAEKPDVIVFTEYTPQWQKDLSTLHATYPYRIEEERNGNFGISLFSTRPLLRDSVHLFVRGKYKSIFVEVDVNGQEVGIIGTHPEPPFSKRSSTIRNNHLENMASTMQSYKKPLAIIGDFNCTPYSTHFKKLLKGPPSFR